MEKPTLNIPPIIPQQSNPLESPQWQWQSDPNPYQESDSLKWSWQDYLDDENLIIEEAYYNDLKVINLNKDYEIDLKKMLQVSIKDKNKVRRIRRQEPSRFMMEMPEAKVIVKNQKTMNEAFGTVQHFLEYIMKRTPEAYSLYQRLGKLSLDSDRTEFADLVDQVLLCIEKGAEVRAKIIKTRTGARVKDWISQGRKIKEMIQNNSSTLQDFLKTILKTYTMETFICYWLNELLRSEDWEEINVLTPYLVCLVYTFKLSDYVLTCRNFPNDDDEELGFVVKHRLYLYRGAALTKEQLKSYNPNKTKYFSWNAVTSTSRDIKVAQKFIGLSMKEITQVRVLFVIEIDFESMADYHGLIDVSKNSRFPNEQEVILAPGTVFKLREVSLIENDVYEIRLRVTRFLKEAHENAALLGVLQNRAISKDKAIIDGLPSQEGFRMLEFIRGNKLIRKLEIRNSGINELIMEEIENIRMTTNVRKEDIELVNNTIVMSSFSVLAHYFTMENFNEILAFNKIRFDPAAIVKNTPRLQIKNLIFKEMFHKNEFWERLKHEIQTREISLLIPNTDLEDNEFKSFIEHIKHWKPLEKLVLAFNQSHTGSIENFEYLCKVISLSATLNQLSLKYPFSDQGLNILQKALEPLQFLKNLSLNFSNEISDEGLKYLKSGLISLTSLQHLSIDFSNCSFSDKGLENLTNGISSLLSLQQLHLGFRNCNCISDIGLKSLKEALTPLKTLQNFSCDFFECSKISIEGLNYLIIAFTFLMASLQSFEVQISDDEIPSHLKITLTPLQPLSVDCKLRKQISDEGLNHIKDGLLLLTSLKSLSLDFTECVHISDQGLNNLQDGLTSLTSLQHLSLNFQSCEQISDQGLNHLKDGLKLLVSLQYLSLCFKYCQMISDKGLNFLKSGLSPLISLQQLSLDFTWFQEISNEGLNMLKSALISFASLNVKTCDHISDEGLNYLKNGFSSLKFLQSLSLDFARCFKISDEGLNYLSNGLASLTSLQNLYLSFPFCDRISDEGLNHLKNGLASLASLQHLSLNFGWCHSISDQGLHHLKSGLTSLTSLQHLSLEFEYLQNISDEGLNHLKNGLALLPSLQHLSLHFRSCEQISDEGFNFLKNGLALLTSLQSLSLNFGWCPSISDQGLIHLKSALILLVSLQHLSLYFTRCNLISDEGVNQLKSGLELLTSLQNVSLDFSACQKVSDNNQKYQMNEGSQNQLSLN